jgi:iron uptake system component EfeO
MKEHSLVVSPSSSRRRARRASRAVVTSAPVRSGRLGRRLGILSAPLGGLVIAAVVPMALATPAGAEAKVTNVNISLTPSGCAPKPAKVTTGQIQFNVANKNAGAVSEAELRTHDLSHILGEQENLTPGLSGGFALVVQPGKYVINCPGASQQHAAFTVTGKAKAVSAQSKSLLAAAASGYSTYVNQQVAGLVSSTQALCAAINTGNLTQAQAAYPPARVYYEHIEPVAEVWGTLDTAIDGRIDNPVTNPADLTGFHRIEEIMWADSTLTGAAQFCSQLVTNEQQLQSLVSTANYNAVTMASGATDLVNEAGTAKITGEEERYSNTDFVVFQANVDGAMEVVSLLQPYLKQADPSLLTQINQQQKAVEKAIAPYKATPGYDNTGYVEYSQVLDPQRRALSAKVQAFAEALSKISGQVS